MTEKKSRGKCKTKNSHSGNPGRHTCACLWKEQSVRACWDPLQTFQLQTAPTTSLQSETSRQSNLTQGHMAASDKQFNRIHQVVPMSPCMRERWLHLVNAIELVLPSAHPSPQPKRQIDRFSLKINPSHGDLDPPPHLTHDSLRPSEASWSVQAFLHRWL